MTPDVLFESKVVLLSVVSVILPAGIYTFLYRKIAISRWTVVSFALLLVALAGIDVAVLQSLTDIANRSDTLNRHRLLFSQLSLILYLLPAAFGGMGINLLSHVLINHLNEAERKFDRERRSRRQSRDAQAAAGGVAAGPESSVRKPLSELLIIAGCAAAEALIFALDIASGAEIRLHVLYIFPLALIARYCASAVVTFIALALTTILQVITFALQLMQISSFVTDVLVSMLASLLITYLARQGRRAYLKAVEQAETDALTSLLNRSAFMARLEAEIARQRRYGGEFSLAMIDLDGFKEINDCHGHHAGDRALEIAAETLRAHTRASDLVGRIGGDEFAVLMPSTSDDNSAQLFEQICSVIGANMRAAGFAVTASIGCCAFDVPPQSGSLAIRHVDETMYRAKREGKNRVVRGTAAAAAN